MGYIVKRMCLRQSRMKHVFNFLYSRDYNKKNAKSPSPRGSTVLSSSYQPNAEHSRAESESGASTISETPELVTRSIK